MRDMWNQKTVVPPLVCTMKTSITDINKGHFKNMKTTMENLTHLLSDMSVWKVEQHTLSKMIYKNHSQRRREKTLQGLKRIKTCVERFCTIEDIKFLEDITSSLETSDLDDDKAYLPSRQMLEFVLVRLMGMGALLTQTSAYCVHIFLTVQQDLEIGIFIPPSMVFVSVISRIWALSKSTCIYMVTWYNRLKKCLQHLEPTQVVWLEDPDILPVCLRKWLEQFDRKTIQMDRATVLMADMVKPNDGQSLDNGSKLSTTQDFAADGKEAESIETIIHEETSEESEEMDEDLGCSVSRNDLSKEITKSKKKRKHVVQDKITKITANQAIEALELTDSLEDLLQLVLRTECPNVDGVYRRKCVEHLQKLMVITRAKKKPKNLAKFVRKGKASVRKYLLMNVSTESSIVQEDRMSHQQLGVVKLEELQTQQEVKNLLVNFRQHNSIFLQGRSVKIGDQKSARRIRVSLKQCMNRIKRNPESAKQSIKKAVKVITSVVEHIEGNAQHDADDQAYEKIWESEQVEKLPREINCVNKSKKVKLDETLKNTAKARKEKKNRKKEIRKKEKSDEKIVNMEIPKSNTPPKRKISMVESVEVIPRKNKKLKTAANEKQNQKLLKPQKSQRKNKKTGKGKLKRK